MWLFGGIITLSKFCVNIAAAKKATARNICLPTLTRSCFTRWNRKNTARTNPVGAAIFHVQFPGTSNDVLCLFGRAGGHHRRQKRQPNELTHRPQPRLQCA